MQKQANEGFGGRIAIEIYTGTTALDVRVWFKNFIQPPTEKDKAMLTEDEMASSI